MNDLRIALENMEEAEGKKAVESLVYDTVNELAEPEQRRMARKLSSYVPKMGDKMALEILAKVGMMLNEE